MVNKEPIQVGDRYVFHHRTQLHHAYNGQIVTVIKNDPVSQWVTIQVFNGQRYAVYPDELAPVPATTTFAPASVTSAQRTNIRRFLRDAGFERTNYSAIVDETGGYSETWTVPGAEVTLNWLSYPTA